MSGIFNRLKNRKPGPNTPNNNNNNNNDNDSTSLCSFDEQGFLCPNCLQKFSDHTQLAQHYTENHSEEIVQDKNVLPSGNTQEKVNADAELWKQQLIASEESRVLLTNELVQEKQRVNDFEEAIQLSQKQLKTTQAKISEQSQEIANLKATKDVYDAQLTILSSDLRNAQNQLKQYAEQETSKLTKDDFDALKNELINKDEQIEKLRIFLTENYQYIQKLEKLETIFNQNLLNYDEIISKNTLHIQTEINQTKQFVKSTRKQKEKIENIGKTMHNNLIQNEIEIKQLNNDLVQQKQLNEKLNNDLQKQTNSSRNQIDLLNNEIQQLEKTLNELKEEKNQLIQIKMDGDEDNQRQNLVRQITLEKDQYEQQTKELRIQIKQITNERQQIQDEFDKISKQLTNEKIQLQNEQTQHNHEIDLLKTQLDNKNKDKERQINELNSELSTIREKYSNIENNCREVNENNDKQKKEIEQMKTDLTKQINQLEKEKNDLQEIINQKQELTNKTQLQLTSMEKEKDNLVQQLQTTLSQLHAKLAKRDNYIQRLSIGIRHCTVLTHRTQEYIEENIYKNQMNVLTALGKAEEESRLNRTQTIDEIREEYTKYLTTVHQIILDSKNKLDKQMEKDNLNLIEQQQKLTKIKNEYDQITKEHHEQKQKFEIQLGELNQNLLQVSETLSESTQTATRQREEYEKQIVSLERELESRTKKHEMQLSALTENLAAVRTELRSNNEKLASVDQLKSEKTDIEARLVVSQDERRALLERSLTIESKNEKLIAENGQISKKNTELESALLEIAREYQVLQIQTNTLSQRRWIDDEDVEACMKCNHTFNITQRKHHCRNCGNIYCDNCSSKTATIGASSRKQKRVCDQCYKDLTS